MRQDSLEVLACPSCQGPLHGVGFELEGIDNALLVCGREDLQYPVVDGIPQLVRRDLARDLQSFASDYSRVWQRDGWGSSEPEYLLNLPTRDVTRRQTNKWRVKARSMAAVLDFLGGFSPHRVVDLGCGVGWLSYHLARRGYEVFAVDVVQDEVLGLRAADVYLRQGVFFERLWGELERPPFLSEAVDAVICNASLHYAASVETVVREARRILRPGGVFLVMNSPVYRDKRSAVTAELDFRFRLRQLGADTKVEATYHHLVRDDLERTLSVGIGAVGEVDYEPGYGFRALRWAKSRVLRMELASFPIFWARKSMGRVQRHRRS